MTRCQSEAHHPNEGFAWTEPTPLDLHVETPRLLVRPFTLEDPPMMFEAIVASREALLPWMPWARTDHYTLASTMEYVATRINRLTKPLPSEGIGVGIFERDTGLFVGGTGFHDIRRDAACVETGYWIRADRQRRGYCTEAMAHWISKLLAPQSAGGLGFNRVRIFCSADNKASARVPEKLALTREVMQRQDYYVPGLGVTDRLGWGVLASEWDITSHRPKRAQ
ncbi:MAG: GNAT family N-acetyltransferase [Phycisphaerales bacterium]